LSVVYDKCCPGSCDIREPRPEFVNCPDCGREVEIWTDELKAKCPGCGSKVFRAQQASCIDWCPHAKECVGPEVYERLKPGMDEDISGKNTLLDVLKREHDQVLESLSLLRAASLCLRLGNITPESAVKDKGIEHLSKVLDFFDTVVRLHFRREENVLLPALEKHFGVEKSPTRLLLEEHQEFWQRYDRLKQILVKLRKDGGKTSKGLSSKLEDISRQFERFLREHIKKEDESLLPLVRSLLDEKDIEEIAGKWKTVSV